MRIFPAIDLMEGRVVRLYQGDYQKSETYGEDPAAFAAQFAAAGAGCLHLVDLDGAKSGEPKNFAAARAVASVPGLFVEFGGGMRDEASVERCFAAGIGRVILGTAALRDPAFTRRMLARYGEGIAIGVDARDGCVAVEGWLQTSEVDSFAFCREMRACGATTIIYTDIARDGAGRGTNMEAYRRLAEIEGLHIMASGGVSTLEEIAELRRMGLYGVILGRALYTGALDLAAALRVGRGEE